MRRRARPLDWANRPDPFKRYAGLEPEPVPAGLERLLSLGAGVIRTRRLPGGDVYHFRSYASAGALYPVEVYVALPDGLFHFHPGELAVRRLRAEDARGALAAAAADPSLGVSAAVLVLTGIFWRTAWKYGARGYRHLFWDAGTMLANLVALAEEPRLVTGFVDGAVERIVGIDGRREVALALLGVGEAELPSRPSELPPLNLETARLARREIEYPAAYDTHASAVLESAEDVRRYREAPFEPVATAAAPPPSGLEGAIRRRGSLRSFGREPISADELAEILAWAFDPIPADVPAMNELRLLVNNVRDLERGVTRFVAGNGFELERAGDFRTHAGYLCLEQALGALSAATGFFLADLERVLDAFGNRGYRAAQLEAGIRAGRVYVGAYARSRGATASTFYDDDAARFVAPGTSLEPMLAIAVGSR